MWWACLNHLSSSDQCLGVGVVEETGENQDMPLPEKHGFIKLLLNILLYYISQVAVKACYCFELAFLKSFTTPAK